MNQYAQRENTRLEHLQEIREEYGYRNFTEQDEESLFNKLLSEAIENENVNNLMKIAIESLRKQKIILPGITTIEKIVHESKNKAEDSIIEMINSTITDDQKTLMNRLINAESEENITKLGWLRGDVGYPSPKTFLEVIERLEEIRNLNLDLNTGELHPNRIRQLSRLGGKYEPHSFRRFDENKRYAILAIYLYELSQTLIDKAIDIHDKQMNILLSKGRKKHEEIQKENGKSLNEKLIHYIDIGAALIKAKDEGLDPFETLETVMGWARIVASVEEAKQLARPVTYDYIDLLDKRYSQLRKYTPILLKHLIFKSTNQATQPLIDALDILNKMNETGRRKVPEDVPIEFISNRWSRCVIQHDGSIDRHFYEMAALTELKNKIRSGDISVEGSRNHRDFETYLVSKDQWKHLKKNSIRLAVSLNVTDFLIETVESLTNRLTWLSKNIGKLDGVSIANGKIKLSRLEKETPDDAAQLSQTLYKMIPKVKLPELQDKIGAAVELQFNLQTLAKEQAKLADDEAFNILGPTTLKTDR